MLGVNGTGLANRPLPVRSMLRPFLLGCTLTVLFGYWAAREYRRTEKQLAVLEAEGIVGGRA